MSLSESRDQDTVKQTGELGTLASGGITQVPTGVNLTVVEPKAAGGYVDYVGTSCTSSPPAWASPTK